MNRAELNEYSRRISTPRTTLKLLTQGDMDFFEPALLLFIEKALMETGMHLDYDPEDIFKAVKRGSMQAWMILDEEGIPMCSLLTEIVQFPKRKLLCIQLAASEDGTMKIWFKHVEDILNWGLAQGCHAGRAKGRKGWEKVFHPEHSYYEFDIRISHESIH